MLNFGFAPPKGISLRRTAFWRILRWCPWWRLGCRWFLEPPKIAE